MKNQNKNGESLKSCLLVPSLLFILFLSEISLNAQSNTQVFHIQNYFSEAYLVKNNDKLVLIETGVPVEGYADSLVNSIRSYGFHPENIVLAIVTHGHGDHAGNAKYLQEQYHIPIAGSQFDLSKFNSGKTELSKSEDVSIWGERLRPNMDMDYPAFTPDILVGNTEMNLEKYGIDGKIIPMEGGHTSGSLLVLIGNTLFVGDAFIGTFKAEGQGLVPDGHLVREHFYHENSVLAAKELPIIEKIAIDNQVPIIYPTHFGPVTTLTLTKYIKEEPTLKELSKVQLGILKEIVEGKPVLANKFLSNDFIFQNLDGLQFSKASYLENYILSPKIKVETITAEDFRIISTDNNTAEMTYIETIKQLGKEPKSNFVTTRYRNAKNGWELISKKDVLQ